MKKFIFYNLLLILSVNSLFSMEQSQEQSNQENTNPEFDPAKIEKLRNFLSKKIKNKSVSILKYLLKSEKTNNKEIFKPLTICLKREELVEILNFINKQVYKRNYNIQTGNQSAKESGYTKKKKFDCEDDIGFNSRESQTTLNIDLSFSSNGDQCEKEYICFDYLNETYLEIFFRYLPGHVLGCVENEENRDTNIYDIPTTLDLILNTLNNFFCILKLEYAANNLKFLLIDSQIKSLEEKILENLPVRKEKEPILEAQTGVQKANSILFQILRGESLEESIKILKGFGLLKFLKYKKLQDSNQNNNL